MYSETAARRCSSIQVFFENLVNFTGVSFNSTLIRLDFEKLFLRGGEVVKLTLPLDISRRTNLISIELYTIVKQTVSSRLKVRKC